MTNSRFGREVCLSSAVPTMFAPPLSSLVLGSSLRMEKKKVQGRHNAPPAIMRVSVSQHYTITTTKNTTPAPSKEAYQIAFSVLPLLVPVCETLPLPLLSWDWLRALALIPCVAPRRSAGLLSAGLPL